MSVEHAVDRVQQRLSLIGEKESPVSVRAKETFELSSTYAFLEDGGAAPLLAAGEEFWMDLMSGRPQTRDAQRAAGGLGWLVAKYPIAEDTKAWEMHPAGEELLVMLSGAMDVVLEESGHETVVSVATGKACIVPRGTWHRQVVRRAGEYLAATYGKGTQHRPR
jgi:mannose-6-phosphate isomerase-like protein (cupin superfamily)